MTSGTRSASPTYETFADDRHLIIYGQRTNDDRIAFGGRGAPYHFGSTVEPRFDQNSEGLRPPRSDAARALPSLEGEITHRWGGPLAMARDQSPSVVVDHESGLASAGGYTGDGVVMSYVAANALADLIVAPETRDRVHSPPLRAAPEHNAGSSNRFAGSASTRASAPPAGPTASKQRQHARVARVAGSSASSN